MCFARGLYCYNTSVKYLLVTLYFLFFIFFGKLATKQMLASDNILMKKQYQ